MRYKDRKGITLFLRPLALFVPGVCLLILFVLTFTGCTEKEKVVDMKVKSAEQKLTTVPIGDIMSTPERYTGKEVIVKGTVKVGLAFEFVDEQPYQLKDKTGQIWVITRGFMPEDNSTLTVKGKVRTPYQIKGRRYSVVILEEERL